ncbi:MAG: sulfite exporter TauE/SafE family protein [Pseudomonadota bacterium]|nr:sulfite exporter TauE/SafE family protein [Pseudomonadota bacterium]
MSVEPVVTLTLVLVAAFFAGALNAVAGGGSFLTLPALVFAGIPPVAANATGTLALLPGYLASAWGFREDIRAPRQLSLAALVAVSLAGGSVGAILLLLTPNDVFRALAPWLLLAATALFAFGPQLVRRVNQAGEAGSLATILGLLAVTVYGGYFNGGLGILLLALFSLLGQSSINLMNGLKNLVSAVLTAIAVTLYAWGGAIVWSKALTMMVAATAGGYLGARLARRLPAQWVRRTIILTGLVMAGLFFAG